VLDDGVVVVDELADGADVVRGGPQQVGGG
jgi:hypothetical protein